MALSPIRPYHAMALLTLLVVLTVGYALSTDSQAATIDIGDDWVVDSNEGIKSDNTYVMRANLTVTGSGQISFRRCTFTFMSEEPGAYGITVQPGGYLTLHTSVLKSGLLTPSVLADPWTFYVQDSGRLSLQSSTVLDLGVVDGPERKRGLAIESSNVLVSGSNFEECARGLVILGGSAPQVVDNVFEDNYAGVEVKGSSFSLSQENTFRENQVGLLLNEVQSASLTSGTFVDNNLGIQAVMSNVVVENVSVSGMGDAFSSMVTSHVLVRNSTVMVLGDRGHALYDSELAFVDCTATEWSGWTSTDSNSHLTVKMSVHFRVSYAGADYPVEGADVELTTKSGSKVYQQVTDSDGLSPVRLILVYEHHRGNQPVIHGPFTATASAGFDHEEVRDMALTPDHLISISFVDDEAPDLTVQLPVDGSFHNTRDVEFKGRVNDMSSGIATFHYSVNGGENVTLPIKDPWQVMVSLPEGDLLIEFVAIDLLGNQVTEIRSISIDITPPTVHWIDPSPGNVTRAYQQLVVGRTEPGATLEVQGTEWEVAANGTFTGYLTLGDAEGEETVDLLLTDPAGNEGTYEYTLVIDRTPPALTVETDPDHRDYPFINRSDIMVFGTAEPGATVKVHINSLEVGSAEADELGQWSIAVELVLGENDLLVDAWDEAGNRETVEIIDFLYDVTPPEITLLQPLDGTVVKNKVRTILVEVRTEPEAVVWVNDETEQVQPSHGEVEFPEVDLPFEGNNTVTIYVRDQAGNLATMSIVVVREEKKDNNTGETDGFPVWLVVLAISIAVMALLVVQRLVRR